MMKCTHCQTLLTPGVKHCPNCGQAVTASPPPMPGAPGPQPLQEQAAAAAQTAWIRIQTAGPAKVGIGLMLLSIVVGLIFKGQRSIWASGWGEIILAVLLIAYLALREFVGQDLLARTWYAPAVAVVYLSLWGLAEFRFRLGSLLFLAGALLLTRTYIWPLRDWARQMGLDWRIGLHGYRRSVAIGSVLGLLSLLLTWIPDRSTVGYWSGGYSYSSYYGQYVYDTMHWYNPGLYLPSYKGIGLTGSVLMMAGLLGSLIYAAFAPQFAVPKWFQRWPLIAAGYGVLFLLYSGSISWGQPVFLVGLGLIGWGGYQLAVKGVADGPGDLRGLPLERWLGKWI